MADYTVEITELRQAIASGALEIHIKNGNSERSTKFARFEDLLARLRYLESLQAAEVRPLSKTGYVGFSRGDR